ncbi:hypothetical protein ABZ568_00740 [Streptomyces olindensis]|uniref:Uncharacterized protein n=1 Tax=Streptomyces olindensis TaxID=358823 RepID=A0ABV2XLW3_9ACTN
MPAVFFDLDPTASGVTLPAVPKWHSLYGSPELAAVRPVRAADVRPGDRWVGTIDTARFVHRKAPLERLRGYWGYEFTAAPIAAEDGRIQLCVWKGEPYVVAPNSWTLVVPACRPAPPGGRAHGEGVTVTEVVARRLAALVAVVRCQVRHAQGEPLLKLLESASVTAALAPVEDGRRLPAVTLDTLQEAVDLLESAPDLAAEIGGALQRSVAPAVGSGEPVEISRILYRVRFIWPDARWVLREPPGVKASLTWHGGPNVEEVGEELRWPDIVWVRHP